MPPLSPHAHAVSEPPQVGRPGPEQPPTEMPPPQRVLHTPFEQPSPLAHACPQVPQLDESDARFAQTPPPNSRDTSPRRRQAYSS